MFEDSMILAKLKKIDDAPTASKPLTLAEQLQAQSAKLKKVDDNPPPNRPMTLAEQLQAAS